MTSVFAVAGFGGIPAWLQVVVWLAFGYCVFRVAFIAAVHTGYGRALLMARIAGLRLGLGGAIALGFSRCGSRTAVRALLIARSAGLELRLREVLECARLGLPPEETVAGYVLARRKGLDTSFAAYCASRPGTSQDSPQ